VYGQPANDECVGATVIPSIPFTDMVDTTTATNNPADPILSCNAGGQFNDGNTVWYVWTPPEDISVNISTDGSTEPDGDPLDTAHGVFTGTCGKLTEVACVDIGLTDDLIFQATGGVTYFIKFGEFQDGVGGGNLVVTLDLPPEPELITLESVRNGVSRPISSLVGSPSSGPSTALAQESSGADVPGEEVPVKEVPRFMRGKGGSPFGNKGAAAALVEETLDPVDIQSSAGRAELLQIFDGAENDDNAFELGILLAPPDTDGDVGPSHYVQIVNLLTTIYDKGGDVVLGPFANNIFWSGLGGLCQTTNRGDPIVLYDEETDSWLVSQFAFNDRFTRFSLCIAVSTTGDPTGTYYQHEFDSTGIGFPDYPKYGFVTDAIGVMVNLFTPPSFSFEGAGLGAIDKDELFSSGRTTMVFFKLNQSEAGFAAGDNDGPFFDNMPPTFATNNGGAGNTIDFWEIDPDFALSSNSTISEVAEIPVSPIDGDLCPAARERCIDQPGSGTGTAPNNVTFLEAISDTLMHRLQLRDFGFDDNGNRDIRAVVSSTVDANGTGKAGIRWYEFRNDGSGWGLHQEDTFSPGADHRWMGSIAMNRTGEICLGYSISGRRTYPSIGIACQTGQSRGLNVAEQVVFDGNVDQFVQRQTARWGDYSAMAVDPVDDTFWYTQEHAHPNSFIGERFGWATKIFQFKLPD
ncbi:MAG: hypothetical protein ACRD1X_07845, partial [Vicinamibacteria bacterium]